jgi:hypothetical protein
MVGGFVVAMFVVSLFGTVDHFVEHDRGGSDDAGYHSVDK